MAQLSFDELSEEEKADVVAFYNSQGMNTGSPITEATLPPASKTLSPPPVTATSLDTGEPVDMPNSSWRDAPVATEVSPTRGIMTDAPDMDEVQAFQERNGLPRDGVLDENTFRAMTAQALAQPSSADAPPVEQENPPQPASEEAPATYSLQSGDTFSKIAAENPFTLNQLIAANPDITDPNNVMIGQEINLPVGGAPVVEAPVVEAPVVEVPTPANSSPVSAEVFEAVIEDQLDQDITVSEMDTLIEPPQFLGEGERISESTRSGQVSGITKNYSLNGVERTIIDVSETTESDPSLNYPAEAGADPVNVQNVVLHYTATLYRNGVRHYMNSFGGDDRKPSAAYFIDRSGQIYETFDPTVKGYHVHGGADENPRGIITNSNSIGVEVEATDRELPTQAQLEATAWLSDYLIAQYGAQRVVAHPQANTHKGAAEGYNLVNYWRSQNNLPELTPSTSDNADQENLFNLAPSVSSRPQARQGN